MAFPVIPTATMFSDLDKVTINPKNPAIPTKKLLGLNKDGEVDEGMDFFRDSLKDDWWDFLEDTSVPKYHEESVTYTIAIKSEYTCTGAGSDLEARKQEYLKLGIVELFKYYNKQYTSELVDKFASGINFDQKKISSVIDYHLRPRPSEKVKFLIEVDAEYLNAVPKKNTPASFSDNLDENGHLITFNGMLNPSNDMSYDGISIVTLHSEAYEREILKTASHMAHHHRNMVMNGYRIKGVSLHKEADRMLSLPTIIDSYVSNNYAVNGVGTGEGYDESPNGGSFYTPEPLSLRNESYKINIAFRTKDEETGELEILWASANDGISDKILDIGFHRFLNTNPISHITILHYLYWHQQILNNLDRNIEIGHFEFIGAYHYPKVDTSAVVDSVANDAPFGQKKTDDIDPKKYRGKVNKCGFKKNDFSFPEPSLSDMLRNVFEPINYNLASVDITFFSLGPPCPADPTGTGAPIIYDERIERLKDRLRKSKENWERMWEEGVEKHDFVGDYYTSEEFVNDVEKRFESSEMKLRKLGDIILNQFPMDKMLRLVCICITQIADQALAEAGVEMQVPEAKLSVKGPGGKFDPSMLSDDDPNFNLDQAFEGTLGSMDPPWGEPPYQMKKFELQQLCSMCIHMPEILVKLPTFDMLKAVIKAILNLLEMLIVQMLMALVMQLLRWLTQCPDYECDLRPRGAAIDDYGSQNIEDFLGDEVSCPVFKDLEDNGIDITSVKSSLLRRISEELSTGEVANLLEGYPTRAAVFVIRDIIYFENQFEVLRPHLSTEAAIEDFIGCISDAAVGSPDIVISDPDYCPSPNNTPAAYMQEKCNNDGETERFLLREKVGKAARLKGIVDAIRNNPNFFGELMPPAFSTRNPDGTKNPGLLSDPKLKPEVADTMIDMLVDPMIDQINRTARRDGTSFLKNLYQEDKNSSSRVRLSDGSLDFLSTAQLATSLAMLPVPGGQLIAAAMAPMSFNKDINTVYPAVGGINLKNSLNDFMSNTSIQWPTPESENPLSGIPNTATNAGVENASQRKFQQRMKFKLAKTNLRLYFETISETLKNDPDAVGGFSNHIVVKVSVPPSPTPVEPPGFEYLPDDHPFKNWFYNNNLPLFDDDSFSFSYRAPLVGTSGEQLVIPGSYAQVLNGPVDTPYAYSPQSKVFAELIKNGLGSVYTAIPENLREDFDRRLESRVHMYALRSFMDRVAVAASESPFFRTYTHEEISNNPKLDFDIFHRENPYSDFGVSPFKQKYSADDKNGRTETYFKPAPALEDTPLRHGTFDLIDVEKTKNKINEVWDWSEQYDPDDPQSISPLSQATIDGMINELIGLYCTEAMIKSSASLNTFTNTVGDVRDKMFSTLLTKLIVSDLGSTFKEDPFKDELYEYINLYMERKYLEDGKNANDAPKNEDAIAALVEERLQPGPNGEPPESVAKALLATNILHLGDDEEKGSALSFIITDNPNPFTPPANAPPNTFHVAEVYGQSDQTGIPLAHKRLTESGLGDLEKGAFIYERYVRIGFHPETEDFLTEKLGSDVMNRLKGPISLEGAQNVNITLDDYTPTTDFTKLVHALWTSMVSVGQAPPDPDTPDKLLNATAMAGENGLFASLTHHIRLSYVITKEAEWKQHFEDVIDEVNTSLELAVLGVQAPAPSYFAAREKSFLLQEDSGAKILVFPIVESLGTVYPPVLAEQQPETVTAQGVTITVSPAEVCLQGLASMMTEIKTETPEGAKYYKASVYGDPAEEDPNGKKYIMYPVPEATPLGVLSLNVPGMVMTWAIEGKATKVYRVEYDDLPEAHRVILDALYDANETTLKENINTVYEYTITSPESEGKEYGIDTATAFGLTPESAPQDALMQTDEWNLLFSYALPESVATNLVTLYTMLGVMENPYTRSSFRRTKIAFKLAIQATASRADLAGRPSSEPTPEDLAALQDEDEAPDYEYSLPPGEEGTPEDNLTLLYDMEELTAEEVQDILTKTAEAKAAEAASGE